MIETDRPEIEAGLIKGIFDVRLFDVSNIENQKELSYEKIISSGRRLWVNSNHPLLKQSFVSLKEVSEYP